MPEATTIDNKPDFPKIGYPLSEISKGELFGFETGDILKPDGANTDALLETVAQSLELMLHKHLGDGVSVNSVRWLSIMDSRVNPERKTGYFRFIGRKL